MRSFIPWSLLVAGLALGAAAATDTVDTTSLDTTSLDTTALDTTALDTTAADTTSSDASAVALGADSADVSSNAALQQSCWNACSEIKAAISSASAVYYPGTTGYNQDIAHFIFWSSQNSTCSFSPANAKDLGAAMKIIGKYRVPFAVKSGGHAQNPGASSTTGVTISMDLFNQVTYNKASSTAVVGSGLLWANVSRVLDPLNVSVAYGRCGGVGVGGYNTGGGYSWKSQQVGLAIDTITAFEVVLSNGTVIPAVTSTKYPDLFFAFKGGLNNFGIATKFTMKTFTQGKVWGGSSAYAADQAAALIAAGEVFQKTNTDPKAGFYTAHGWAGGQLITSASYFFDGPGQPPKIFDAFMAIPSVSSDVGVRTMTNLIDGVGDFLAGPKNWMADHVGLTKYSASVLKVVIEQATFWGQDCVSHGCVFHANLIEPFHSNLYAQATDSAWPHGPSHPIFLGLVEFEYNDRSEDAYFANAIKTIIANIHAAALADGQDLSGAAKDLHYSNYAKWDVPVAQIYGENLPRLKKIKAQYDPNNIMGLAGGFKI